MSASLDWELTRHAESLQRGEYSDAWSRDGCQDPAMSTADERREQQTPQQAAQQSAQGSDMSMNE